MSTFILQLQTDTTMESRNPTIVRILEEKGSVIENRHSGIPTMKREMEKYGLPEPEFYEERDSFKVIFRNKGVNTATQSDTQLRKESDKSDKIINKILEYCVKPKTAKEIREHIGISSKRYVASNIIKPLINQGKLDYTNKNSINARNQKYVTIINDDQKDQN